ncbi:hypothetical protein M501DRAFT_143366 [Patellaria atrata CBS 101060]|uniref:Uncharacterized protein n=1 Tax=Patellaria atrata CBS 101060 TaxID=1346257 RepID=A0A9P4SA52_9PEZI|nr:hypothetical protein M501DRAFT_143366 [Patellaria atrata CBS 101060]
MMERKNFRKERRGRNGIQFPGLEEISPPETGTLPVRQRKQRGFQDHSCPPILLQSAQNRDWPDTVLYSIERSTQKSRRSHYDSAYYDYEPVPSPLRISMTPDKPSLDTDWKSVCPPGLDRKCYRNSFHPLWIRSQIMRHRDVHPIHGPKSPKQRRPFHSSHSQLWIPILRLKQSKSVKSEYDKMVRHKWAYERFVANQFRSLLHSEDEERDEEDLDDYEDESQEYCQESEREVLSGSTEEEDYEEERAEYIEELPEPVVPLKSTEIKPPQEERKDSAFITESEFPYTFRYKPANDPQPPNPESDMTIVTPEQVEARPQELELHSRLRRMKALSAQHKCLFSTFDDFHDSLLTRIRWGKLRTEEITNKLFDMGKPVLSDYDPLLPLYRVNKTGFQLELKDKRLDAAEYLDSKGMHSAGFLWRKYRRSFQMNDEVVQNGLRVNPHRWFRDFPTVHDDEVDSHSGLERMGHSRGDILGTHIMMGYKLEREVAWVEKLWNVLHKQHHENVQRALDLYQLHPDTNIWTLCRKNPNDSLYHLERVWRFTASLLTYRVTSLQKQLLAISKLHLQYRPRNINEAKQKALGVLRLGTCQTTILKMVHNLDSQEKNGGCRVWDCYGPQNCWDIISHITESDKVKMSFAPMSGGLPPPPQDVAMGPNGFQIQNLPIIPDFAALEALKADRENAAGGDDNDNGFKRGRMQAPSASHYKFSAVAWGAKEADDQGDISNQSLRDFSPAPWRDESDVSEGPAPKSKGADKQRAGLPGGSSRSSTPHGREADARRTSKNPYQGNQSRKDLKERKRYSRGLSENLTLPTLQQIIPKIFANLRPLPSPSMNCIMPRCLLYTNTKTSLTSTTS